jgi:4-amino-4-deoxy-L-arabinose transferase-like glycosyltransferase
MKKNNKFFVFGIIFVFLVALLFRFWKITEYPVSLTLDEVGFGYDGYSILRTGKDEWGARYPLVFKAIGDYKPAVDVYMTALSVGAFGLNEFGVRFPVALLGTLSSVVFIFLLTEIGISSTAALFGGFFLAISPWHVHFSRANFESTVALFFVLVGTWLMLVWTKKAKTYLLSLGIASFALSAWSYNSERLFTPLLFIFLMILFRDKFKALFAKPKRLVVPIITLLIFLLPFLYLGIFTDAIRTRPLSTSILREASLIQNLHNGVYKNLTQRIFDNDLYLIFRHWGGKYLNYFDLNFWFWKGMQFTPPGYPDLGLMYAVDLPLFLYGLYALAVSKNRNLKLITFAWFLLGPLAASFTMNEQHSLRAMTWLPFFGIVIAAGVERFIIKSKRKWLSAVYFTAIFVNIIYFGDIYLHQFPRLYSEFWQYGYKQVAEYACDNLKNYDKIVISDTFGSLGPLNTGTPFLYVLFYCKEDRDNYLLTGKHLDKFEFRRPNVDSASGKGKLLLIGSPWDFLDGNLYGGKLIHKISFLNGVDAFWFVERK